MGTSREDLLQRVMEDVAHHGIGGRSLRDIAVAARSSHRMLLYHFGSREGLVAAIVAAVEGQQQEALVAAAASAPAGAAPEDVVLALWDRVSDPELRPFVRLFFEALATAGLDPDGGADLTAGWLDQRAVVGQVLGAPTTDVDLRLGVAVVRGLLVDVIATGDTDPASESLRRFLELWRAGLDRDAGGA